MRQRLIIGFTIVSVLSLGMALTGIARPDLSDVPMRMFFEPIIFAGIIVLVCTTELVRRRAGVFSALICASPMWMLTGAAPQGAIGALIFFLVTFVIGSTGILLAMLVRLKAATRG